MFLVSFHSPFFQIDLLGYEEIELGLSFYCILMWFLLSCTEWSIPLYK